MGKVLTVLGRIRLCLMIVTAGPAFAQAHPGAAVGEQFTFKFSIGPLESGRARMSIGTTKRQGKSVLSVRGQAQAAPWVQLLTKMEDEYTLLVDPRSLLPLEVVETERGSATGSAGERHLQSLMSGRVVDTDVQTPQKKLHTRRVMPTDVHDPLSAFFAIRTLPLQAGDHLTLDILDDTSLWRSNVTVKRGFKVHLDEDGPTSRSVSAILLEGISVKIDDLGRPLPLPARTAKVWLSDDAHRVLLRMEADTAIGRAALELTSYQPGSLDPAALAPKAPGIVISRR